MSKTPKKRKSKVTKAEKFSPNQDKDIKDLTEKALATFLQEKNKYRDEVRSNINALSSVIEEFLSSFIIIGYTIDGSPINIISAHNQQEADSLTTLINKFIGNCMDHSDNEKDE